MTDVSFKRCGCPLSDEAIRKMESQLDAILPGDYREFLAKYNGGTPTPNCFDVPLENFPDSWVDDFHSADENLCIPCEDAKGNTIAFNHFEWGDDVPGHYLIIGTAGRDHKLLLCLRGEQRGQVHLKLVHGHVEEQCKESDVYVVGESFTAFCQGLYE